MENTREVWCETLNWETDLEKCYPWHKRLFRKVFFFFYNKLEATQALRRIVNEQHMMISNNKL